MMAQDKQIPISVVIPTYNRRESLQVCLTAFTRQTLPADQFEVVVVSDGSSDGTNEFLITQAASLPYRLVPVVQENGGPARARNRGIQEAQGLIVVFLDDDMEAAETCLAQHLRHHEGDDKIVVIGPMLADPARRSQEPVWIAWEHTMLQKQYDNWRTGVWPGAGPNHFYSGNASVRREYLLAVGGFDETFKRQEDVELAGRLARDCNVHFCFDYAAAGTHRPLRTFASWLNIPRAYGRLDVVRVRATVAGEHTWREFTWARMEHNWQVRNRITRLLTRLVIALPALASPLYSLLLTLSRVLYALHCDRIAVMGLSVLYNTAYMEAVSQEIGDEAEYDTHFS